MGGIDQQLAPPTHPPPPGLLPQRLICSILNCSAIAVPLNRNWADGRDLTLPVCVGNVSADGRDLTLLVCVGNVSFHRHVACL